MSKRLDQEVLNNRKKESSLKVDSVKILSDMTKKDIEKSYKLESISGTEAHYSNRYGWTLRRSSN